MKILFVHAFIHKRAAQCTTFLPCRVLEWLDVRSLISVFRTYHLEVTKEQPYRCTKTHPLVKAFTYKGSYIAGRASMYLRLEPQHVSSGHCLSLSYSLPEHLSHVIRLTETNWIRKVDGYDYSRGKNMDKLNH